MNIYDALILKALGGGGGTTVVANPEGEATDELEKLQVGSDIYGIPKDYEELDNKPQINGETLIGNKIASELGLQAELDGTQTVSGNPITVADAESMNAESVVVELESKQDLHGYDAPWVGGAGKNKLPLVLADIKSANTSGTWSGNTYTLNGITFEVLTDSADNVLGVKVNGTASANILYFTIATNISMSESSIYSWGSAYNWNDNGVVCEAYDGTNSYVPTEINGISIPNGTYTIRFAMSASRSLDNETFYPMIRKATESADFEPYSNICPITGYSEVNVERVGENLFDKDNKEVLTRYISGNSWVDNYSWNTLLLEVDDSKIYTTSGFPTLQGVDSGYIGADKTTILGTFGANTNNKTHTLPSGTKYIGLGIYNIGQADFSTAQLELGNQATTYEPYQGNTYTIDLDGTKYGGTLDVTEGVLTVDRAEVDLSSLTWEAASRNRWNAHIDGMRPCGSDFVTNAISDSFVATTTAQLYNDENYIAFGCNEVSDVYVRNGSTTDTPTGQLVYELAIPLTIQLTSTQIQMLENTNNISTDGTNITLKYQPNNVIGECKAYTDEKCSEVLPPLPTTDGTYHLSCEVTSGVGVLSWVSDS